MIRSNFFSTVQKNKNVCFSFFVLALGLLIPSLSISQTVFKQVSSTSNTTKNYTIIDHQSTNAKNNVLLFVNHDYDTNGPYVSSPLGVWQTRNKWSIFKQDKTALTNGTTFNVLVIPESNKNAFKHNATASNTTSHITTIDHPATNGKPNAKLIVSQNWSKQVYNNNPIGVYYDGGKWKIFNQNQKAMPSNAGFNILVDHAKTFEHTASSSQKGHITNITSSKIIVKAETCVFVTQLWKGVYNSHEVGVWKNGSKWTIYNEDRKALPSNVKFNVLPLSPSAKVPENTASNVFSASNVKLPFLSNRQDIMYEVVNGKTIFQGDIILGTASEIIAPPPPAHPKPLLIPQMRSRYGNNFDGGDIGMNQSYLVATNDTDEKWSRGIVPYIISPEFTAAERTRILNGLNTLDARTNLTFIPRTRQNDYINFDKEDLGANVAGNSYVGRCGGSQDINLNSRGSWNSNSVIHETLHAIGVYHEQSRSDRDNFVIVNTADVPSGSKHNFRKCDYEDIEICGSYDVNSIMHYSGCAFVDCGAGDAPSIIDRSTGLPVRSTGTLSPIDVDCINLLYPIDASGGVPPLLTSIRNVKLIVKEINSYSEEGGVFGIEPDFFVRSEIGAGTNWNVGNGSNSTQTHTTPVIDDRMDIHPHWEMNAPIPVGATSAKVAIRLLDEDTIGEDEFDINPLSGGQHNFLSISINMILGEIWLMNSSSVLTEFLGFVGDDIFLEGYHGDHRAAITFNIAVSSTR